jgi:hypothetical protein
MSKIYFQGMTYKILIVFMPYLFCTKRIGLKKRFLITIENSFHCIYVLVLDSFLAFLSYKIFE